MSECGPSTASPTPRELNAHTGLPQLIRIPVASPHSPAEEQCEIPALRDFFARRYGRTLLQFGHHMRFLTSPFHMFYCVDSYIANTHHNRAIASLTEGALPRPRPWPGTVLVFKLAKSGDRSYVDVESADILDVREYFAHLF